MPENNTTPLSTTSSVQPTKKGYTIPKPDAAAAAKLDKRRRMKDRFANTFVVGGGLFILIAVLAIFFYLLKETLPLFVGNSAHTQSIYTAPAPENTLSFIQLEDGNTTAMRLNGSQMDVIDAKTGAVQQRIDLAVPTGDAVVSVVQGEVIEGNYALGLASGGMLLFKPEFNAQGLGAQRVVTASISYPMGEHVFQVNSVGTPLTQFAFSQKDKLWVAAKTDAGVSVHQFANAQAATLGGLGELSFNEEVVSEPVAEPSTLAADIPDLTAPVGDLATAATPAAAATPSTAAIMPIQSGALALGRIPSAEVQATYFDAQARYLFVVAKSGAVAVLQKNEAGDFVELDHLQLPNTVITASTMLQGNLSLLLGDSKGTVHQLFLVNTKQKDQDTDLFRLTSIRTFQLGDVPITVLATEKRRKGIIAGDAKGQIGYFYSTSNRQVFKEQATKEAVTALSMNFHTEGLLVASAHEMALFKVHAEHPDVSVGSLWGKVWYESYPKADYVWQSTSGNADFEAKLSLVPLTFGTIKAAFWAMLLGAPLAIAAAMYTAAFMSSELRSKVKPTIELMQALPTVILGFLAGLWLAPIVSENLSAVFSLLIVVPVVILCVGLLWSKLPQQIRNRVPDGYTPIILIVPIVLAVVVSFAVATPLEHVVFAAYDGSLPNWLKAHGVDYQAQNALIVGLMMGFAIIAPIYSIAEDALFGVPKHLINGSLALGATPWQTLMRVTVLTAAPGIFSALMIGFGRAVGETMIVLMATGNTPIMDMSLFNGMRTLSANIAVEMGEAEVGSTHFRVLFLSALVLFVLTFVLNTLAEVVRNRLRKKYGSL